jgi:hypothetical protein
MKRPAKNLGGTSFFNNASRIHYDDAVSESGKQSWVVRDEYKSGSIFTIESSKDFNNLCLY